MSRSVCCFLGPYLCQKLRKSMALRAQIVLAGQTELVGLRELVGPHVHDAFLPRPKAS